MAMSNVTAGKAETSRAIVDGGLHSGGSSQLLSSEEMAEFVARGFLRFDALVPADINDRVLSDMRSRTSGEGSDLTVGVQHYPWRSTLSECFYREPALQEVVSLPRVAGIIESLVGPEPYYDHHAVHVRGPGAAGGNYHGDAVIDARAAFDLLLMYYPQRVAPGGGPTVVVPGSHLRQVNSIDIARYQNIVGQVYAECPPGTVFALHHGIWHCATRNRSEDVRYMVKFRFAPRVEQVRLWDTGDLEDVPVRARVVELLDGREPWFESSAGFVEKLQRTALFRRLCGDPGFEEAEPWLGRLENQARPLLRELLPTGDSA
jgi:hypothetical protein